MKYYSTLGILILGLILLHQTMANAQTDSLKLQSRDTLLLQSILDKTQLDGFDQSATFDSITQALALLKNYQSVDSNWSDPNDPFRLAIIELISQVESEPIDSVLRFLREFPYDSARISTIVYPVMDPQSGVFSDTSIGAEYLNRMDSLVQASDSLLKLESLGVTTPGDTLRPSGIDSRLEVPTVDTLLNISLDTLTPVLDSIVTYVVIGDSIRNAIKDLIHYVETKPKTFWIVNATGDTTIIRSSPDEVMLKRFWLKNNVMDSVGIWVETTPEGEMYFFVDDGVRFQNMKQGEYRRHFKLAGSEIDTRMKEVTLVEIKKSPWKLSGIGELLLSQVYLQNWAKGGQNSLSALFKTDLDAIYNKNKIKWENAFRAKYGIVNLQDEGVRKSEDQWEINASLGFRASKLWFYSFAFNFKSQFSPGFNYPNDSVIVSNFLAPGYLYSSAGFEYNPNKVTQILVSPLTYRSTFVVDTSNIEHTKFGIPQDKKASNEIGIFIKAKNTINFTEDLSLENRLQVFTDYIAFKKIDFDWEANFKAKFGPFFTFNFNIHLIYNSDVTFPVLDDTGTEIDRKAKLQFKEWMGFGLSYRF